MTKEQMKQYVREVLNESKNTPSAWAAAEWAEAKAKGYVAGFNGNGTADKPLARPTREQAVCMIMRAMDFVDEQTEKSVIPFVWPVFTEHMQVSGRGIPQSDINLILSDGSIRSCIVNEDGTWAVSINKVLHAGETISLVQIELGKMPSDLVSKEIKVGNTWDGTVANSFAGGTGSKEDPYLISTAAQLAYLSEQVNLGTLYSNGKYFELTNDIVLNKSLNNRIEWTPIGKEYNRRFSGNFNGNGYSIYGLYINSDDVYSGLFGYVSGNLENTKLIGSNVKGGAYVGSLVGSITGMVVNCFNSGVVKGSGNYIGGIIGSCSGSSKPIEACSNEGEVSGKNGVGGVLGYCGPYYITLLNCINNAPVSGDDYVGGLVGNGMWTTLEAAENTGTIKGKNYVGSAAGNLKCITNYVNSTEVSGVNYLGGVVGAVVEIEDCVNYYPIRGNNYVGGVAGSATTIVNCQYDGPITGTKYVGGIAGYVGTLLESCQTVANVEGEERVGRFAGYARKIVGCINYMDISGRKYVGGIVGEADIVESCQNYGNVAGEGFVGGIAGGVKSIIVDSSNFGMISSGYGAGGITGSVIGAINKCLNAGDIHALTGSAGGIVGSVASGGVRIEECENRGAIIGKTESGGIVGTAGSNTGTVNNCKNSASVSGENEKATGEIVGYGYSGFSIKNSYSNDSVVGKIAGGHPDGTVYVQITDSYFLDSTGASENPQARTSTQLKQKSTYENWDFDTTWTIDEGNDYPKLRWTLE